EAPGYAASAVAWRIDTRAHDPLPWAVERKEQTKLLRDIFNPFRPVIANPRWLTSDVVSLTTSIYAERAFDRLPILADALQDACMTLPYSRFPLRRALDGIKAAGYSFVAWGTTHNEGDKKNTPVLAADAPPEKAKELAKRCRDTGLEPVLMFSDVYPEAKD